MIKELLAQAEKERKFFITPEDCTLASLNFSGLTRNNVTTRLHRIVRFGGASDFTVAYHSRSMSDAMYKAGAPGWLYTQFEFHDAAEIFVGDIPSPVKPYVSGFKEIEEKIEEELMRHLGVRYPFHPHVKTLDKIAGFLEKQTFVEKSMSEAHYLETLRLAAKELMGDFKDD